MSRIKSCLSVFVFFAGTFAGAASFGDTLYITIPQKDGATLQAADVTLKLDKKTLPVKEFFSVDASARTPQILSHPAGRRQYILVFDLIYSKPADLLQSRAVASSLIDSLGQEDLAAVAVMSRAHGVRFWSGLTQDRDKLFLALNAVGRDSMPGTVSGPDGNLYPENFNDATNKVELIPEDQFLQNVTAALSPPDEKEKKIVDPVTAYITGLNTLSYTLMAIQGPRTIVLFSPGFDTKGAKIRLEEESFSDSYVDAAISNPEYLGSVEEQRADEEAARRQQREARFQASPVIQVDGIPEFVAGTLCTVVAVSPGGTEYEFLSDLTGKSGGFYLRDEKEIATAAERIRALDQKYYVIGFEGRREKQFKELHSLSVEAGTTVLNPSAGWVAPRAFDQYSLLERKLHVSQALYKNFDSPASDQKFWSDFSYQQGPKITLFSQLSGDSILKQDVDQFALEAHGFFIDPDGRILDYSSVPVRFDLKNKQLRERLKKAGVRVWSMVLGDSGPGTIRWVLVDSQFGDTTTYSTPIVIQDNDLTTTQPFFPSTNFDWLIWPKPQDPVAHRGVQLQYPYSLGQDLFFPELDPGMKKSDSEKYLYFRIYNRVPESKNPPIHMYLVDSSGKQTEIEQFALMQKPKELENGGMELFWKLMSIPDVPPGSYRLQVNIRDALNKKDVVREIPLEIR